MCWLFLVAVTGVYSSLQFKGFSLQCLLLLQSTGFRPWASVVTACGLRSCGVQAQLLHGTWNLPGPGIKPMSPALAGGFLTTKEAHRYSSQLTISLAQFSSLFLWITWLIASQNVFSLWHGEPCLEIWRVLISTKSKNIMPFLLALGIRLGKCELTSMVWDVTVKSQLQEGKGKAWQQGIKLQ